MASYSKKEETVAGMRARRDGVVVIANYRPTHRKFRLEMLEEVYLVSAQVSPTSSMDTLSKRMAPLMTQRTVFHNILPMFTTAATPKLTMPPGTSQLICGAPSIHMSKREAHASSDLVSHIVRGGGAPPFR